MPPGRSRNALPDSFHIGEFHVEPSLHSVSGPAGTVRLEAKVMQVLLCLAEHGDHVVPKERLIGAVWPDTFVAESSLQFLIHEIRQAIDDPGGRQSWLRTIHGIGYSFCGEVLVSSMGGPTSGLELPAAWLIENAGFHKGLALGNAGISTKHTLALINRGGASAAELLTLKEKIQHAVEEKFGIQLQAEPIFVGFD